MPKIHTSRRKLINAPPEAVYDAVANMDKWQAWSPWLMMEPEAVVTLSNDGNAYSWSGKRVGDGHMTLTEAVPHQSARYDLTFLKPFKSHAKVGMDLKAVEGGTEVTWSMDSALPFFMFFMKKMMETFIGMDYDRGLNLLKDYAEDGQVHSKLNFLGTHDYAGTDYTGLSRRCSLEEMPRFMQQDFERIGPWAAEAGLDPRQMFCIYHKFDLVKGRCQYTAAIAYKDAPDNLPTDFITGHQAAAKIYTLEHVGRYEHLGNGWSALHNMIRGKEINIVKNYHPFETYKNSPTDTPPHELVTHINFAVKTA